MKARMWLRCRGLPSTFFAIVLFSTTGSVIADEITGNGAVAEFKISSPAVYKGKVTGSFVAGSTYSCTIDVDASGGSATNCGGTYGTWATSREEIAGGNSGKPGMVWKINNVFTSQLNANVYDPAGTLDEKSTVCVVADTGRTTISTWSVYTTDCPVPCGVGLVKVGTGSSCIHPLRIEPMVTFAAPKLEFRGAPVTNDAWIQVQASGEGNPPGVLVNVQIPMGTPLDAPDNEDSVGRLVTDALNANGYTATNLHVLPSPHDNDIDSSGESLFIEVSQVGNDEADMIELLIYHSQPDPPGEEPIEEMDIGATTLYGVQFDEINFEPVKFIFHRGDVSDDGEVQIDDPIKILNYLFLGGLDPSCLDAADADNNGSIQLTDAVGLLSYLFLAGLPPQPPWPLTDPCGVDTGDSLGCLTYDHCDV